MQSNYNNGGVICSTMQRLQIMIFAASANCQQLTQQHTITLPLFQVDLTYGPSTDRIDRPAIRSPWGPVPVTAPRGQSGRLCRTLCQSAIRPNIGHTPYRAPPAALVFGSQRQQSRPGFTQSHPEPMSTLDLLGLSPIAAGMLQLFTACAVAVLWAVAVADWLTADQPRKIRLLASCGHSQASISRRLGVSRYQVRKVLK